MFRSTFQSAPCIFGEALGTNADNLYFPSSLQCSWNGSTGKWEKYLKISNVVNKQFVSMEEVCNNLLWYTEMENCMQKRNSRKRKRKGSCYIALMRTNKC